VQKATILGGGISGLSTSFHVGHENCVIYEARSSYGGHCRSDLRDGVVWDDGPHVSYGPNMYVHDLFAEAVDQEYQDLRPVMSNYFRGHWIDHPAQSNLYQVPEPLRSECLKSFLNARSKEALHPSPSNYEEWLHQAFGPVFAETFPAAYTRKYWTANPSDLGVDWLAFPSAELPRRAESTQKTRVYYPNIQDIKDGSLGPLGRPTNYVTRFRYPSRGGFVSFLRKFADGARIRYGKALRGIHFGRKELQFEDGTATDYDVLVSTIPLPSLIKFSKDAPQDVTRAAAALKCTNFLLVNVVANHPAPRKEHWVYVYDEDKLSTRISFSERFSPNNTPAAMTGISVEVYGSEYRTLAADHEEIARRVQSELVEMGLVESLSAIGSVHTRFVPTGNPIFDHDRRTALDTIFPFLEDHGVMSLGRFAEWEYLMTHDCVMASRQVAEEVLRRIRA
jgi:protoporphyrinogen oxidase